MGQIRDQQLLLQGERDPRAIQTATKELHEVVENLRVELLGAKPKGGHPITIKAGLSVGPWTAEASTEVDRSRARLAGAIVASARAPPSTTYLTFFSQLARDQVSGCVGPFGERLRQLPP